MGNKKIIMLVGSILLGALAGFALLGYVRGVEDEVLDDVARVPVWVVSSAIPEGTTAQSAQATASLELSEIESSFRPANAITDLAQIDGQIAASDLVANQIVLAGSFVDPSVAQTTFANQIDADHVAFSITISKARAVNGFLEPGDFVDIIVLGDPPIQAGEGDVFESSLQSSPYERPARTLFRGVRIESIDNEVLGEPRPEGEVPEDEEEAASLDITLAIPSSGAQRVLSVSPEDIVLALLPTDWEPAQQANEITEAIIVNEDLPGEDPTLITPYGADGFIDALAEGAADDDAAETAPAEEAPAEETAPVFEAPEGVEEVEEVPEAEETDVFGGDADADADADTDTEEDGQ